MRKLKTTYYFNRQDGFKVFAKAPIVSRDSLITRIQVRCVIGTPLVVVVWRYFENIARVNKDSTAEM